MQQNHTYTLGRSTNARFGLPQALTQVMGVVVLLGLIVLGYGLIKEYLAPVAPRHGERANPWRGLPGCLRLHSTLDGKTYHWPVAQGMSLACGPKIPALPTNAAPGQASILINSAYALVAPPPDAYAAGAQTIEVAGTRLAKAADAMLTLDPRASQSANPLLACLTQGDKAACTASQLDATRWAPMFEGAAMRMAALVDIRIADGAVQVLSSAHSPCFAASLQAKQGVIPTPAATGAADCPSMPVQYLRANAGRRDNHATHTQAMWASLVKPAMALSLLRNGPAKPGVADWMEEALKKSDTPVFMNHLFCKSSGYPAGCKPLAVLGQAGRDLGYMAPAIDLMAASASSLPTPAPHWLQRPIKEMPSKWEDVSLHMPTANLLKDCASRLWSVCRGEHLAELSGHAWGQSDGKATPLAAAAVFARLGAAANGQTRFYPPHLLARSDAAGQTTTAPQSQALHIDPRHAQAILQGMAQTHTFGGTAHSACVAVWGTRAACDAIKYQAGKTGTQTYPHAKYRLSQRLAHCAAVAANVADAKLRKKSPAVADGVEHARCSYAPYKWFAMLAKDSDAPNAPWSRVIVILAERNWVHLGDVDKADKAVKNYKDGVLESAKDEVNIAAFTAMQYLLLRRAAVTTTPAPTRSQS